MTKKSASEYAAIHMFNFLTEKTLYVKNKSLDNAFLQWKSLTASIKLDQVQDRTIQLQGLLNMDKILTKHLKLEKKVCFV